MTVVKDDQMPNRVIREGIIDSDRIDALVRDVSWAGECFYRRLHSIVDDYGRHDARVNVLKAKCYPTMPDIVREADLSRWLAACDKAGLIRLYECEGRKYLEVLDFNQFMRAKKSRCPDPPMDTQSKCSASAVQMRTETETETETERVARKRADDPFASLEIPEALRQQAFLDSLRRWVDHRRELKKPLKPTGLKAHLSAMEKLGAGLAVAAMEHSMANGWQGCFEPKGGNTTNHDSGFVSKPGEKKVMFT